MGKYSLEDLDDEPLDAEMALLQQQRDAANNELAAGKTAQMVDLGTLSKPAAHRVRRDQPFAGDRIADGGTPPIASARAPAESGATAAAAAA